MLTLASNNKLYVSNLLTVVRNNAWQISKVPDKVKLSLQNKTCLRCYGIDARYLENQAVLLYKEPYGLRRQKL